MTAIRRNAFGVWNGYAPSPESGPKALPYRFDFSATNRIEGDLLNENTLNVMQFVQGMYVDNSDNAVPFTLLFRVTNQRIVVPANSQGTYMVLAPDQTQFVASMSSAPGRFVDVLFLNVPTAYTQWGPVEVNATIEPRPLVAPASNFGGTIAVANVAQQLFPANTIAVRRWVQNPSSNVGVLNINVGGGQIELTPGQSYDTGAGPLDVTKWEIIAPVGTPTYRALEWSVAP